MFTKIYSPSFTSHKYNLLCNTDISRKKSTEAIAAESERHRGLRLEHTNCVQRTVNNRPTYPRHLTHPSLPRRGRAQSGRSGGTDRRDEPEIYWRTRFISPGSACDNTGHAGYEGAGYGVHGGPRKGSSSRARPE